MTVSVSYPGVYVEEIPVSAHTVTAAATSNTAFIDYFTKGPVGTAVEVTSLNQFNAQFGGLSEQSEASYGIQQYFLNGGAVAWVVRVVPSSAATASATLENLPGFEIDALNAGTWGNTVGISAASSSGASSSGASSSGAQAKGKGNGDSLVNLDVYTMTGIDPKTKKPIYTKVESYYNLGSDPSDPSHYAPNVVNGASQYIALAAKSKGSGNGSKKSDGEAGKASKKSSDVAVTLASPDSGVAVTPLTGGEDGTWKKASDFATALMAEVTTGTAALDNIAPNVFNLLCMPAAAMFDNSTQESLLPAAMQYCQENTAFMIVDPPPPEAITEMKQIPLYGAQYVDTTGEVQSWVTSVDIQNEQAYWGAVYYPWLTMPDPVNQFRPRLVAPSGTMAGIYAATDNAVGVWKAPAGVNAVIQGANLVSTLSNQQSGALNESAICGLRSLPIYNNVCWGARTLAGIDQYNSVFKYINVRRLTNFIEESLQQSLVFAVFEDNGPSLWSSLTVEVTDFLAGLFSQGAFQGSSASQAYFVQCDSSTTTTTDIQQGIVNVVIGFAPITPAEFVVLQIEVEAGPVSQSS